MAFTAPGSFMRKLYINSPIMASNKQKINTCLGSKSFEKFSYVLSIARLVQKFIEIDRSPKLFSSKIGKMHKFCYFSHFEYLSEFHLTKKKDYRMCKRNCIRKILKSIVRIMNASYST